MSHQTVLVTGANGFLGSAVAKAFSLAGWTTYGLIRNANSSASLLRNEVIPIIGSAADLSFISSLPVFDVIVSTTEDVSNYSPHFNDTISMLQQLSQKGHKKPLILFTSGCKDYGTTKKHGEVGLRPHGEEDPLNPPIFLTDRTTKSLTLFEHHEAFDAVVLRPTTMYGHSGSYYAPLFMLAEQARESGTGVITLSADPNSVLHGTHVDDVAAAYLALASAPRSKVVGQIYNISNSRYETLQEISEAIEKSYGLKVAYTTPIQTTRPEDRTGFVDFLLNFPQWVGSEKIRGQTGWKDRKMLFAEGFEVYRRAFEQAVRDRDEGFERMRANLEVKL